MDPLRRFVRQLARLARGSDTSEKSPVEPTTPKTPSFAVDTFEPAPAKAAQPAAAPRSLVAAFRADTFSGFVDGFEGAVRAPVNLSGGLEPITPEVFELEKPAPVAVSTGFVASLDDLFPDQPALESEPSAVPASDASFNASVSDLARPELDPSSTSSSLVSSVSDLALTAPAPPTPAEVATVSDAALVTPAAAEVAAEPLLVSPVSDALLTATAVSDAAPVAPAAAEVAAEPLLVSPGSDALLTATAVSDAAPVAPAPSEVAAEPPLVSPVSDAALTATAVSEVAVDPLSVSSVSDAALIAAAVSTSTKVAAEPLLISPASVASTPADVAPTAAPSTLAEASTATEPPVVTAGALPEVANLAAPAEVAVDPLLVSSVSALAPSAPAPSTPVEVSTGTEPPLVSGALPELSNLTTPAPAPAEFDDLIALAEALVGRP